MSTSRQKMDKLVKEGGRSLYSTTGIFPFAFFPDSVMVEENKVTLLYRLFFFSKKTFPFLIEDIKLVTAETNPFFGTLIFELEGYEKNPPPIKFLPPKEADRAVHIITGLVKAKKSGVDLADFSKEELLDKVTKIGETPS